jgi:hypothetical protein
MIFSEEGDRIASRGFLSPKKLTGCGLLPLRLKPFPRSMMIIPKANTAPDGPIWRRSVTGARPVQMKNHRAYLSHPKGKLAALKVSLYVAL